jgi:hypothetical protein
MFSPRRIFSLFAAVLFAAFVLAGCDNGTTNDVAEFSGTWKSSYGEYFTVNTTTNPMTYTSASGPAPDFTGATSYDWKGEIVGDVASDKSLLQSSYGYLVIKVTDASDANTYKKNKYIAVHWKNLTSSAVDVSAPFKTGSTKNGGVDTPEEAKTEYTADNGYFDSSSSCTKQ